MWLFIIYSASSFASSLSFSSSLILSSSASSDLNYIPSLSFFPSVHSLGVCVCVYALHIFYLIWLFDWVADWLMRSVTIYATLILSSLKRNVAILDSNNSLSVRSNLFYIVHILRLLRLQLTQIYMYTYT